MKRDIRTHKLEKLILTKDSKSDLLKKINFNKIIAKERFSEREERMWEEIGNDIEKYPIQSAKIKA